VCDAAPLPEAAPRPQEAPDPTAALPADASQLYAPGPNRAVGAAGRPRVLLVGAVAFLLGALCGVGGLLGVRAALDRPAPQTAEPESVALPKFDPLASRAPAPAPRKPAAPEVAPMPHEVIDKPVAMTEPEPEAEFRLPQPLPEPGVVVTHTINKPDDTYPIPAMKRGERVVLKGKVKTLRVHGLDAGSVLDASGLEAAVVTVTGKIDNGSTLKLHAPRGVVHLTAKVDNFSSLDVRAPEGEVRFMLPTTDRREGSKIDNGSKVAITARAVEFRGDIAGNNTRVAVTLTRSGFLKVASVGGKAAVEYRALPGPLPDVVVGDVARTATFRRLP
jgi:hypothetical protein